MSALPLFILNGWSMSNAVLQPLGKALSARIKTQILSSDCEHGLTSQLEQLAATLPPKCVLAGWSWGGLLAAQFAAIYPGRVQQLLLINTPIHFVKRDQWREGMDASQAMEFFYKVSIDDAAVLRQFLYLCCDGAQDAAGNTIAKKELRQLTLSQGKAWPNGLLVRKKTLQWLYSTDLLSALNAVNCPIMVIQGAQDQVVPASNAVRLSAAVSRCKQMIVPGMAHFPAGYYTACLVGIIHDELATANKVLSSNERAF